MAFGCSKEAELLSRALGAKLIKTSVKEDINVNAVFWYLATQCLAEIRREEEEEEYSMIGNGIHPVTISEYLCFSWMDIDRGRKIANEFETVSLNVRITVEGRNHEYSNVLRGLVK